MKRYLFIFALLLGALTSYAQSATDQVKILQQCMDIPALQQLYPIGPDQKPMQVVILQETPVFSNGLQISKSGKSVQFTNDTRVLGSNQLACFVFQKFSVNGNTANVTFDFHYTRSGKKSNIQGILVLTKSGENWTISETKLNGR